MAEVIVAETAGFCFGVQRAVDTVYEQIEKGEKIYTFGPIIHNEEVVKDLEQRGVEVVNSEQELKNIKNGTIIIRSHGVSRSVYQILQNNSIRFVDATCPFVKKIHKIVEKESAGGKRIVIIGNRNHPEVQGIMGWSDSDAEVIESVSEAEQFAAEKDEKLCIVAQTTFNYKKFKELVEIFQKKGYDVNVVNTICNATEVRQTQAREIAGQVDVMVVIGGAQSSNTRKLYEICKKECERTYYIQTLNDLDFQSSSNIKKIGITAGASTPNNLIEEVQNYVRINF